MLLGKCIITRSSLVNKYLLGITSVKCLRPWSQNYHATLPCNKPPICKRRIQNNLAVFSTVVHRKWYSKGLLDGNVSEFKDYKLIKELFPEPRMTLNNLSAKTPQKIFDVHFKQYVAPKVGKKKQQKLDWTCTYTFIWPEKMKFECTALSKRQAADKAATQALYWLHSINRIDGKGCPIYDKNVLENIKSTLNEPIQASVSENSMERIERIWNDYENGIKQIFEKTSQEAKAQQIAAYTELNKDSTIDEEELSEHEIDADEEIDLTETSGQVHPLYGRMITPPSQQTLIRREEALKRTFVEYEEDLLPLPIDEFAEQITSTLDKNRALVVVGAAGCGKSTRVPPLILRGQGVNASIVVTEPRRVAAIGLAERVASELHENVGESVGYQVRLHAKPPRPPAGSILYCTSGVLLNRLQQNTGLIGCSHVILDEAHERDVNTDVTMLLLKRAMDVNKHLKVIIMSATLDTAVFTRYFDSCPVVEVPGRTFPVEVSYLDDIEKKYNLKLKSIRENCTEDGRPFLNITEIVDTIKAVDKNEKEGAILVFLPGWAEIKQTKQLLDDTYSNSGLHIILPVHSRLSATDQSKMFSTPPPGIRKIVLATNIAETSVTIPDVIHVIDTGIHKQNQLKHGTCTSSLETVWVSLAGAKQRCGRAGRVQPGNCFRLYTKEKESEFVPHTTPEILRIPLEKTVLDCKSYAPEDKAQSFLSQLPEPPSETAIKLAVDNLIDLGALNSKEQLTRLGSILCRLTLSPRVGTSLVHSCVLSTTLAVSNVAVHCDSGIELFVNASDRRDEIREIKRKFSPTSDHASLHHIQEEFERELTEKSWRNVDSWCQQYQLKKERLAYVKSLSNLYLTQLLKSGLIETHLELDDLNRFSSIDQLIVATLLSGINAMLITKKCVKTKGKLKTLNELFTSTGDRAHIASESVNYNISKRVTTQTLIAHCGGQHSSERRALLLYRSSLITPEMALLFCRGKLVSKENDNASTIMYLPKHRLEIHVPTEQVSTLLNARQMLWNTFQYYIDRDIKNLDYTEYETVNRFKIRLVKALGRILVEADKDNLSKDVIE